MLRSQTVITALVEHDSLCACSKIFSFQLCENLIVFVYSKFQGKPGRAGIKFNRFSWDSSGSPQKSRFRQINYNSRFVMINKTMK